MNTEDRLRAIEYHLIKSLHPNSLTVTDEGKHHVGHPGASTGAGHFAVRIVSDDFHNKTLVERHRMVYQAVTDLLENDIHALKIDAKTPDESSSG